MQKVILITGASSGIGEACADYLFKKGHIIFGTSRKATFNNKSYQKDRVNILPLELRDEESIKNVLKFIIKCCGRIDVIINNAGSGLAGPIEDTPIAEIKYLIDGNFLGSVRLIQHLLPIFRKQSYGLIINISSLAGRFSLPFQGFYAATKFALEAVSESLHMELYGTRIRVVIVEPGDMSTNFTKARKIFVKEDGALKTSFERALHIIEKDEIKGAEPLLVAKLINQIIESENPKLRYKVGREAWYVAILHWFLPSRIFLYFLARHYGL